MRIQITADSTCDLSPALKAQYGIAVCPLSIVREGQAYRDGVEIVPEDIYASVRRTQTLCRTAAPNLSEYLDFFRAQRDGADAIVHFTISSEMSSSYQNACLAGEEIGDVFVVDSRSLSLGVGLLALEAAELAQAGHTPEEICRTMEARREKLDVSFVLDTLQYLAYGGRCPSVIALGANLLGLKPTIQVSGGRMSVGKKYRMSLDRAAIRYIRDRLSEPDTVDPRRVFLVDSGIDPAIRAEADETVRALLPDAQLLHGRAGCAISNHCGPNTFSLMFFRT